MRRIVTIVVLLLFVGIGVAGYFTRSVWIDKVPFLASKKADEEDDHDDHHAEDRVELSEQAQANLKLDVRPLEVGEYWRKIQLPGKIIDQPGHDLLVAPPAEGIITRVHIVPGDIVAPGDRLFTLRILSDHVQTLQQQYQQAKTQLVLTQRQKDRLEEASRTGVVSEAKILELDKLLAQHSNTITMAENALLRHGLTDEQLAKVAKGEYVTTVGIVVPEDAKAHVSPEEKPPVRGALPKPTPEPSPGNIHEHEFEVQKVVGQLGQRVDAGNALAILANHNHLYIEGHGFKKEAPLIEEALRKNWDIEVEFSDDDRRYWDPIDQPFHILWMGNKIDEESRTFPFYLVLNNQSRVYTKGNKTRLVWRFRPGQRLRLRVPVERFENVFVLPREAVVRDGPEAYVFRKSSNWFQRKPVHVLYEDSENVVLAKKGIYKGSLIARNAAAALNRAVESQGDEGGGHHHHHH